MINLQAIEEREKAATEAPWKVEGMAWVITPAGPLAWHDGEMKEEDAEFVAHARTDIPALIAEVKRLEEELHACDKKRKACAADLSHLQEMMEGQRERGRRLVIETLGPRRAAEPLKEVHDA